MSFKDRVVLDAPRAVWMLDDSSPYQDYSGRGATASGTNDTGAAVVSGAAFSSIFSNAKQGTFTPGVFLRTKELKPFTLEAWIYPIGKSTTGNQAILSHPGDFDGLIVNDTNITFKTTYATSGQAAASYDIESARRVHVVGVHTDEANLLYIDGALVASVDISDTQYYDLYASTDTTLVAGETTSGQFLAMNGAAVYARALTSEEISAHYAAGIDVLGKSDTVSAFGGTIIGAAPSEEFLSDTWENEEDWEGGYFIDSQIEDGTVTPLTNDSSLTLAGQWFTSFPLDYGSDTDIYGVVLDWIGAGFSVDVSLNGTSWTAAARGQRTTLIADGFDPTDLDLLIRVNFASGLDASVNTPAWLGLLTVTGYVTTAVPDFSTRAVSATGDVAYRYLAEPAHMRDDAGIYLNGVLTIGVNTADDAPVQRTVELWVKRLDATALAVNATGTNYRNGAASAAAPPVGEWVLMHTVSATDITTAITITGNVILGQVAIYDTALSAAQVAKVYKNYIGRNSLVVNDPDAFGVQSLTPAARIFAYDWSVTGTGG